MREVVEACPDLKIKYLTIFAFSTENWKRTQTEVAGLMSLFRRYISKEMQALSAKNVRVRFIGDRVRLDKKLIQLMDQLEPVEQETVSYRPRQALGYLPLLLALLLSFGLAARHLLGNRAADRTAAAAESL